MDSLGYNEQGAGWDEEDQPAVITRREQGEDDAYNLGWKRTARDVFLEGRYEGRLKEQSTPPRWYVEKQKNRRIAFVMKHWKRVEKDPDHLQYVQNTEGLTLRGGETLEFAAPKPVEFLGPNSKERRHTRRREAREFFATKFTFPDEMDETIQDFSKVKIEDKARKDLWSETPSTEKHVRRKVFIPAAKRAPLYQPTVLQRADKVLLKEIQKKKGKLAKSKVLEQHSVLRTVGDATSGIGQSRLIDEKGRSQAGGYKKSKKSATEEGSTVERGFNDDGNKRVSATRQSRTHPSPSRTPRTNPLK